MKQLQFLAKNKRAEVKNFTLTFEHVSGNLFNVQLVDEIGFTLTNGHVANVSDGERHFQIREGKQIDIGIQMSLSKNNIEQIIINKIGGTKKDRFTIQVSGNSVRS